MDLWCKEKIGTAPIHNVFSEFDASIKSKANIADANGTPVGLKASTSGVMLEIHHAVDSVDRLPGKTDREIGTVLVEQHRLMRH